MPPHSGGGVDYYLTCLPNVKSSALISCAAAPLSFYFISYHSHIGANPAAVALRLARRRRTSPCAPVSHRRRTPPRPPPHFTLAAAALRLARRRRTSPCAPVSHRRRTPPWPPPHFTLAAAALRLARRRRTSPCASASHRHHRHTIADATIATPSPTPDRKSTRLNSSHSQQSRMPSSA